MGKRNSLPPNAVAHVEDADDNGEVIPGSQPKYARSIAHGSPRKQQSNISKTRKESRQESRRTDTYSATDSSDSTAHPTTAKGKSKSKPKEDRRTGLVVSSKQRPAARSSKTAPPPSSRASDEPHMYYPQHATSSRPRAQTRPESYYGQSAPRQPPPRPPISTPNYYHHGPPPPPFQPPPPGLMAPSFPPPMYGGPPFPGHMPHHPHPPPPPVEHHYPPRDLASRFNRPSSAMGYRQVSNPYEYDPAPEKSIVRRSSTSRKASKENKDYEDRKRMPPPPPPRPKSTRPLERIVLRPQPLPIRQQPMPIRPHPLPITNRKSVVFDDHDDDESSVGYHHSIPRRESGVEYGSSPFQHDRLSYDDNDVFYLEGEESVDEDDYDEPPPRQRSRSRRRSHVDIEDKIRDASRYQHNMEGGPTPVLTAEALRKVKSGSSRSTRSSASRDESEYKLSATTHTTRSSSGDDDITIKVSAGCTVEVGGAKIHCRDGGDISIGRIGSSRSGSDRGTSIYSDERRSRSDRSSARTRASSQAAYARGLPAPSRYGASPYTPSPLQHERYDSYDDSD